MKGIYLSYMKLNEQLTKMKSIMGITESTDKYPYACAMLYFNEDTLNDMHNQIDHDDLYISDEMGGYGLETEPHCTLLYGLHDDKVTPEQIEDVLSNHEYTTCRAHNLSLFENPKYDVLKYDIEGDNLKETNDKLKEFPFTTDYPDYHPHMTVAYLKPGKGKQYVDRLSNDYKELSMVPQHAVYSRANGDKIKMPVRLSN